MKRKLWYNDLPERECPKCQKQKPAREFRIREELVTVCRACRERARLRKVYLMKKSKVKLLKRASVLDFYLTKEREQARDELEKKKKYERKMAKREFNRDLIGCKRRLKAMEMVINPGGKTLRAIAARKEQLYKYEMALAQVLEIIEDGRGYRSIRDYLGG